MPTIPAIAVQHHETGNVTYKATAATVAKTFVAPSADVTGGPGLSTDGQNVYRFATCGAGKKPAGVAKTDVAINALGGVHGQPGQIVPVIAGAAITAGVEVESDANGKAIPLAAGRPGGLAMSGAASGADVQVKLY